MVEELSNIIICFDGDESGYKAALRAAENSIIELKPEKKILFLFLPNKHDPDSYVNEFGKNKFLEFSNQNTIQIHEFIFKHYFYSIPVSPVIDTAVLDTFNFVPPCTSITKESSFTSVILP